MLVWGGPTLDPGQQQIIDFALHERLPLFSVPTHWVDQGALMAYSVHMPGLYTRAAEFVDRILKGAKPADLPIEQPSRFELVVNLKTAKTIGLSVPRNLLVLADRIIE